ncbi:MAG: cytochrome b [Pigmentiphaga sp.]
MTTIPPRYNRTAVLLHWLIAVMILGTLALGLTMVDLPLSPNKLKLYSWHKWAGMTVFALVIVRVIWRLTHQAPALPSSMGPLSRLLAHAGHWTLYALMVAIPLSGWLMSSAQGFSVVWFGVLPIPDLVPASPAWGERLASVHTLLNDALLVVLAGHIGAALYHYLVKKDGVMARMVPFLKQP